MSLTDKRMIVTGGTTLKNTVIDESGKAPSEISTTNVVSTINYILENAGTGGGGGGISDVTSSDRSVSVSKNNNVVDLSIFNKGKNFNFFTDPVTVSTGVPGAESWAFYGTTESTIHTNATYAISVYATGSSGAIPIGSGLYNTQKTSSPDEHKGFVVGTKSSDQSFSVCVQYWINPNKQKNSGFNDIYQTLNKLPKDNETIDIYIPQMSDLYLQKGCKLNLDWDVYCFWEVEPPGEGKTSHKLKLSDMTCNLNINTNQTGIYRIEVSHPKIDGYVCFYVNVVDDISKYSKNGETIVYID